MFLLCIPPPPTSSLHFQEAIKHLFGCDAPKLYKNLRTNGISEKLLLIQIYSDSASGHLSTVMILLENNNNFKVKLVTMRPWKTSVFPDEIKTKLMKMSKLINIFYVPLNYAKSQQSCTSFY